MTSPKLDTPDVLDLLTRLVATPSLSREEANAAALLAQWLRDHGLDPVITDNNVIVRVHGREPGPVMLLNSHLDTVPAKDGWETDPWTPVVRGGELVGLGSGDAKASVSAMACATVATHRAGLAKGTLIFAATCMEEIGGGGLEHLRPTLGPLDAALVGEPTGLDGAIAQGGLLILEAETHGRTAHAARAHQGVNALTLAAHDLLAIDALELDRIHPFLGPSTANVTVLRGGDRRNVIPDRCAYTVDIRYTPSYSAADLVETIDAITRAEINIRSQRLKPVQTDPESSVVRALVQTRPDVKLFGSPTLSDWVHLHDVPAVKIGPGDSNKSHTPNESVSIAQVKAAVPLYAGCVRGVLEGIST